jgi:hypothetical protein
MIILSIFCLWVAFNALFMVPGRYDAFRIEVACFAVVVAILLALISRRLIGKK